MLLKSYLFEVSSSRNPNFSPDYHLFGLFDIANAAFLKISPF